MNIQRKIVVRGKVQGVGFRNATWRKAMELGIRGSVQNLDDGSVEILVSATDKEF
ncbi:MAG: acylphosphatase, partial [Deltaproteobacteria bacterium]